MYRCYRCGQEGHTVSNCPNPRKNYGCFNCGDMSHHYKDCPKKEYTNGNKSDNKQWKIGGPAQSNQPTARTFNMTVLDATTSRGMATGTILVNNINS